MIVRNALCCLLVFCSGLSLAQNSQTADSQWSAQVASPAFEADTGPIVLVDAAHGNFHTIDGRYAAFANVLRHDGFRVRSADAKVTPEMLAQSSIFVISNAIPGGSDAEWVLPTPPAFTPDEIGIIEAWVANGGSLWLIADHMPFPGATATLAERFGVIFINGFALNPNRNSSKLSFTRAGGMLADHAIVDGRSADERVAAVTSFTGQAFLVPVSAEPLMLMPDDWQVWLTERAWEFSERTPAVSTRGLVQGAVLQHGKGRVAVFGEAAMFTAQTSVRNGVVNSMGMNHPDGAENAQFLLNVAHWLVGLLEP